MRPLWMAPLVLALLVACGSDDPRSATADDPTTTTAPTSTTAAASGGRTVDDGSVEVSLAVPGEAVAGERLWAEVTVRNVGDQTVYWQAGGDSPPVSAVLVDPDDPASPTSPPSGWSGAPEELGSSLLPPHRIEFREEGTVGLDSVARTSDSRMQPIRPGEEHTLRVAADVRLPPGGTTALVALAVFVGYDDPDDYGGPDTDRPRPPVVVEVPVAVTGLPTDGAEEAVDAFAADSRLAAFVEATDVASVDQSWYAQLVWWRDAWELVVDPQFGDEPRGQSRYRLRFDPDEGRIVDARRIWWDQAPADDPDATRFPKAPPDDVE